MTAVASASEHKIPTGTLKQIPVKDIIVGERFRKDFSEQESFLESVRDKGILQPITVDKNYNLLAGERRFRAAQAVGLEKIPALVRHVEDELDAREIELIENIFRKDFTWQEHTKLIAEIDRLYRSKNQDWTVRKTAKLLDQPKSNIWRSLELAKAMETFPELSEQATAHDAFKLLKAAEEQAIIDELVRRQNTELEQYVSAEDSKEPIELPSGQPSRYSPDLAARLRMANTNYQVEDVFSALSDIEDNSNIRLIECDPPYGIDFQTIREGDKASTPVYNKTYEEIPFEDYPQFLEKLTKELYRVANKDCWMIFWFASAQHSLVKQTLLESGWKLDDVPAVWIKPQGQTMQPEFLLSRHYEPFFICYKGRPYINKRGRPNVFQYSLVPYSQKYHPTERPIELIEEILDTFGIPGQVVFVPFLGSGSTLRACYRKNRPAYGCDMNAEYKSRFMLAVEQDFVNQPAKERENASQTPNT